MTLSAFEAPVARPGPILLWRKCGGGSRGRVILSLRTCRDPCWPRPHVHLGVYALAEASVLELAAEGPARTIVLAGIRYRVEDDFTATVGIEDGHLDADPGATPSFVAWLEHELEGKLRSHIVGDFELLLRERLVEACRRRGFRGDGR